MEFVCENLIVLWSFVWTPVASDSFVSRNCKVKISYLVVCLMCIDYCVILDDMPQN
jgi:hypothetical protein